MSARPTECRYCRHPATKGRCRSNHFLAFYIWGAHWRHLAKTTETSMCGGDVDLCQITLTTCYKWATVCKMFRPTLSDRCLSVCPVCDLGVLWPNSWKIRMPFCTETGLSRGYIVIDMDPSPAKRATAPKFSAHVCCGQTAGWMYQDAIGPLGKGGRPRPRRH